jgi:molybdopterin-synthase adenylyltransferase
MTHNPSPNATFDAAHQFARHHVLPFFGAEAQSRLAGAHVVVVGAGGIGSPLLTYLASSGIGHITLVDPDRVARSNLPRQILFEPADSGRWKVDAARDRLEELAPHMQLHTHATTIEEWLAATPNALSNVQLVLDGCDQFQTRLVVNAACIAAKIPLISGAMIGWEGHVISFAGHLPEAPCYACWVGEQPIQADTCQTNGVLSPLGAIIGGWMAAEALKQIAGNTPTTYGTMQHINVLNSTSKTRQIVKDVGCISCNAPSTLA